MVQRFYPSSFLNWVILLVLLTAPAAAHNVEVTEDVAGTWHIEPNHSPKAGENARIWVALTRRGGAVLPLEQANCQISIYTAPRRQSDEPVLQPKLEAITVEKYQGIPGANVVFPQTGLYDLELDCTPKLAEDFQPFHMAYKVTVAEGVAQPSPVSQASPSLSQSPDAQRSPDISIEQPEPSQQKSGWEWGLIILLTFLGMGIVGAVLRDTTKR
jgi:hypothetical protein